MIAVYLACLRANGSEEASLAAVIPVTRFPCVVGRGPECDRRVTDASVSRRHCLFTLRDGRAWVEDLGSSNGTRLNGEPLTAARPVADGDRLDLARLSFRARLWDAAAAEADRTQAGAGEAGPSVTVRAAERPAAGAAPCRRGDVRRAPGEAPA
jgi:predicted component of type VI protein secretion system